MTLHLNKFESPSPKDACFVSSLVEIDPVFREKKISKFSSMYFCYFELSSIGKVCGPSFEKKIESPSPKDILC